MHRKHLRGLVALAVAGAALLVAGPAGAAVKAQLTAGTVKVTGDGADDKIAFQIDPTRVFVDVGEDGTIDFSFDRGLFTAISVAGGGGNDDIRFPNGFAGIPITIDGGAGNDTLVGSDADEVILGGAGNDVVDGNRGNDTVDLGAGNDSFQWDPGDGSDTVAGGLGRDELDFNGSNAAERIALAANGAGVVLTRDVAAITMGTTGLEAFKIRALGSADVVHVGDLTGTGTSEVDVALGAFDGTGDGAADTVVADGTNAADAAHAATASDGSTFVKGLAAQTHVTGGDAGDRLEFDGLGGDDTIDDGVAVPGTLPVRFVGGEGRDVATYNGSSGDDSIGIANAGTAEQVFSGTSTPLEADSTVEQLVVSAGAGNDTVTGQNGISGFAPLEIDGGIGNDTLAGGDGDDTIVAGSGDDVVDGNRGNDTASLGTGNDHFQWDPGDGSDQVDGGGGADQLDFNGSNIGEQIDLTNDGDNLRLHRNVADVTTETANVEKVAIRALGGADAINVGDLSGTSVGEVDVALAGFDGTGDASADTVVSDGTDGADTAHVASGADGSTFLKGLAVQTHVTGGDAGDRLEFDGLGGDDSIDGGVGVPGTLPVRFVGGDGNDLATYNGSDGDDTIGIATVGAAEQVFSSSSTPLEADGTVERLVVSGGAGNDTITGQNGISGFAPLEIDGGDGNDTLSGGDGADTIVAGSGDDVVDGNRGNDTASLGLGNDRFQWDPGDGSDVVDGGPGADELDFNGSNAGEHIDLSNLDGSLRLHRDIADVTVETTHLEKAAVRALGSADAIGVGDLTGTAVGEVDVALAGFDGNGDGSADAVTVAGTDGNDAVHVGATGSAVTVDGLAARTVITGAEPALDTLSVLAGAGRDTAVVDPAAQALIGVTVDLGADQ